MPFKDRKFALMHIEALSGGVKHITGVLSHVALMALETIIKERGGTFEILEHRETETIFRVSPDITALTIRHLLSAMGLKLEIRMVVD
jgi:uncharacterized protein YneF (UPF0154 family)